MVSTVLLFAPVSMEDNSNIMDYGSAGMKCNAEQVQEMIGKKLDVHTEFELRSKAGANSIRVGKPGSAFTMDYREDRVNVIVDDNDVITRIYCG